ncbi:PspC domain-containing protein [Corynebacterium timonense]|nr:PspC domain-containing protein [Corynebacterium timonense]
METTHSTLQELWATRPPRIPEKQGGNAVLAGVCEGIGARYSIDPVLVRLAFVALTLAFGGGIFLYLLFWLNMPLFGTTTSPWRAVNADKSGLNDVEKKQRDTGWALIVGLVLFFPTIAVSDGGWAASALVTLALGMGAIYLLHRSHPVPPEGLLPRPATSASTDTAAPIATATTDAAPGDDTRRIDTTSLTVPAGYEHPAASAATPPSWDPLGAAPQLWHLPDPAPVEGAPSTRKRGNVLRGVLIALVPITVVAIAAAAVGPKIPAVLTENDATRSYVIEDDLADTYDSSVGTARFDMAGLRPLEGERSVSIDHGIGTVTIVPPRDVRVEFACEVGIGTHNCPSVLNDDAEGPTLTLTVDVGIGDITVEGASS